MLGRPFTARVALMIAVTLVLSAVVSGCPGAQRRHDSPTVLEDTLQLYLRSLQGKNWREAAKSWSKDKRGDFMDWVHKLPAGVKFATYNITGTELVTKKTDTEPFTYTVYVEVERYADNAISLIREEWTLTAVFDDNEECWFIVKQETKKLP